MSESSGMGLLGVFATIVLGGVIAGGLYGCPQYGVYEQRLAGQAKLAEADSSREVAVREARAKKESAELLADAEISRARGVAEANKIIGDSLKGNDAYLRYLWINNLENSKNQVIYIPTEGGLPVLEAGRFGNLPVPK